jgi:tetratricopeptide (TPR) repeat protein
VLVVLICWVTKHFLEGLREDDIFYTLSYREFINGFFVTLRDPEYRCGTLAILCVYLSLIISIAATVLNFIVWAKEEPGYGLYAGILYVITFVVVVALVFYFSVSETQMELWQKEINHPTSRADPNLLTYRALCYCRTATKHYSCGEYQNALEELNKAKEIDPEYTDAYLLSGDVHLKRGEYDYAIAEYEKALQISPKAKQAKMKDGIAKAEKLKAKNNKSASEGKE